MKNQYVGDIGDYGKLGMLRFIKEHTGLKLGINWYMTGKDDKNDGGKISYMKNASSDEPDPTLFKALKTIIYNEEYDVMRLHEHIKADVFYNDFIEDYDNRNDWHTKAFNHMNGAELIYLDPDNGLIPSDKNPKKYVLENELKDYVSKGNKSVIFYQHRNRPKDSKKDNFLQSIIKRIENMGNIEVEALKFAHNYFFIVIMQPIHKDIISKAIEDFKELKGNKAWFRNKYFTEIELE